jgi:NADH:ubiquinone oxidoreductase subunit 6 (subunit J)
MDSLHAIGFYVSAALSVTGGLVVAFVRSRDRSALALAVSGLGVGGIYLSLSAGYAGLVAVVCFAGCALLVVRHDYRVLQAALNIRWRQLGAIGAAALLVALAYSAYRGRFAHGLFGGSDFDPGAVGKMLVAHDAMATEAVGALVLVALVGASVAWRSRDRGR